MLLIVNNEEYLIDRDFKKQGNFKGQQSRGYKLAFFNGMDGLPGYSYPICQDLLGYISLFKPQSPDIVSKFHRHINFGHNV